MIKRLTRFFPASDLSGLASDISSEVNFAPTLWHPPLPSSSSRLCLRQNCTLFKKISVTFFSMHDMFSSSHLYFDIVDMLYWMRIVINLQIESQLTHTQTHTRLNCRSVGFQFQSDFTTRPLIHDTCYTANTWYMLHSWYMIHATHSGEKSDFTIRPRPRLTPVACLLSHWKWTWWVMIHDTQHNVEKSQTIQSSRHRLTLAACLLSHWKLIWWVMIHDIWHTVGKSQTLQPVHGLAIRLVCWQNA